MKMGKNGEKREKKVAFLICILINVVSTFLILRELFDLYLAEGCHAMKMGKNGEKGEKRVKKSRF